MKRKDQKDISTYKKKKTFIWWYRSLMKHLMFEVGDIGGMCDIEYEKP